MAILIVAGLVVGGLVGSDIIGEESSSERGAGAGVADPSSTEAPPGDAAGEAGAAGGQQSAGSQPRREEYCAVSQQLDQAGRKLFARLEQENATRRELKQALRNFVEQNDERIDDFQRLAPAAIRSDVRTVVANNLAQAGVGAQDAPNEEQAQAAQQRVARYEERVC